MRYSLLSRFQGTLLAAVVGDGLGVCRQLKQLPITAAASSYSQTLPASHTLPAAPVELTDGHSRSTKQSTVPRPSPWVDAAIDCVHMLIQTGSWSESQIDAIGARLGASRMAAATLLQPPHTAFLAAEFTLATLPIAMFFHENTARQQQVLAQTVQLWQGPPGTEVGLLAVGYAIAQALQGRLEPLTLVPQTVTYLKQSTANPTPPLLDLIGALEQVQILLQQGAGLQSTIEQLRARVNHLGHRAIALAFYCCLSTPDDLHLALLRAVRSGEAAPIVCALTGALSGSHNSVNGLPLTWRFSRTLLPERVSAQGMNQVAAQLFAVWSGNYTPSTSTNQLAIAAPGVIRPR